ncbi:MAG: hypothetical protein IPM17_04155 [Verrucomicrobia bacterium]|nr:hypothetical protein [Verrucomicrobiota bacterium]
MSAPPTSFVTSPASPRQAVVTVVYGSHAERLDYTFTSFHRNPHLELHAFVIGDRLPANQVAGVRYHLRAPDRSFSHPMRDADFRRWCFIDELEVEYAVVVDGMDVLCLRPIPPLPELLRGGAFAGCVEHDGGRRLGGGLYTSNFLNAGVTFWNIAASRAMRQEIETRGRTRYRNLVDDQLALNEVIHTRYFDHITLLPCHYNYRGSLGPRPAGWPRTSSLDGVRIYHNRHWIEEAKRRVPTADRPPLSVLPPDAGPLNAWQQRWRRFVTRWRREGYR